MTMDRALWHGGDIRGLVASAGPTIQTVIEVVFDTVEGM